MEATKKVMIMVSDLPNWTGGPIINIRRLLPRIQAHGHEVIVLVGFRKEAPIAAYLEGFGIKCEKIELPLPTELVTAWILEKVIKHQPDVFIGDTIVPAGYAIRWLNQWGLPSIMMARGIDQNNMEIAKTFFGNGDEFRASALVCVNARIKDWVLTRFPVDAHWVRVIPSGPPASAFSAKYPSGDEPFKLVFAGVIREHPKRVSKIFNYFQHALTQFPKLQLTFIGDGPMRPVLEKMTAEAGLVGKVHFTGILLDEQYKKELANHHVLLLFSDNEGTPGCVMDAMSCSVVPLCKRIPGIDFLVNDSKNGLIFDGSKPDFMEKLERIIDPHFWEKASIESKNDFATQFSLDIITERWLTLIDDLSQKSKLNFPKQAPTNLRLPMLRYHMANADRRKNRFQFLVRGAYIVHQRLTAKLKGFSK